MTSAPADIDAAFDWPDGPRLADGVGAYGETEQVSRSAMLSRLILSRRCRLSYGALLPLLFDEPLTLLAEARALAAGRAELRSGITDALFGLLPNFDDEGRRSLLSVKRMVHNDRPLGGEPLARALAFTPAPLREALADFQVLQRRESELRRRAETAFAERLKEARRVIAGLARDEEFLKGIQLSGRAILASLRKYGEDIDRSGAPGKESRKTELRLISFLYRMSLKPSPFGAFVELRFHLPGALAEAETGIVRRVLLARMLLLWIMHGSLNGPRLADLVPLRLNPTVERDPDRISFFRRGEEGAHDMYGRERFVSLPRSVTVDWIVEQAAMGPNKRTLVEGLVADGQAQAAAAAFVERLIECGLLERNLGVPDQVQRYARAAAVALRALDDPNAELIAAGFDRFDAIERELAEADVSARTLLIERLHDVISETLLLSGVKPPEQSSIRTYFYEEVGCVPGGDERVTRIPARLEADLARLVPLVSLFDEMAVERLALYSFFRAQYGAGESGVDLLGFYKAFAHTNPNEIDRIMAGKESPEAAALLEARQRWISEIAGRIEAEGDSGDVDLAGPSFDAFIEGLPPFAVPWASTSFYLQPSCGSFTQPVVLNGACMGHGGATGRFCGLMDDPSPFTEALRMDQRQAFPGQRILDLTAVLGTNTNLHPPVWAEQIEYPGSTADPDAGRIIRLPELEVAADHQRRRLILRLKETGEPVHLAPLNSLYPTVGPSLYRFLGLLSAYGNHRGRAWLLHIARRLGTGRRQIPRLRLGGVVLQRRSWIIPGGRMAELAALDPMQLPGLEAIDRWRRDLGLPDCGFYSGFPDRIGQGAWRSVEETIRRSRQVRFRKPHFVDFRNPFLCRALKVDAAPTEANDLLFEECLPHVELYEGAAGRSAAEEFIVQLDCPVAAP